MLILLHAKYYHLIYFIINNVSFLFFKKKVVKEVSLNLISINDLLVGELKYRNRTMNCVVLKKCKKTNILY